MDFGVLFSHDIGDYFVGREHELQQLRSWAKEPRARILVSGPAGVGKTALVKVFAQRNSDMFPGGVTWISASSTAKLELTNDATGPSLLVIDDAEYNPDLVKQALDRLGDSSQVTMVVITRDATVVVDPSFHVLVLAAPDFASMVEARLRLIPGAPTPKDAIAFMEANPAFFGHLQQDPRAAAGLADALLRDQKLAPPLLVSRSIEALRGAFAKIDKLNLTLLIVVTLMQFSGSARSEARIRSDIQQVQRHQTLIERMLEAETSRGNPHVLTAAVHLRSSPERRPDNSITVLLSGQEVEVLGGVDSGWVLVEHGYAGQSVVRGWVFAKYLKPASP